MLRTCDTTIPRGRVPMVVPVHDVHRGDLYHGAHVEWSLPGPRFSDAMPEGTWVLGRRDHQGLIEPMLFAIDTEPVLVLRRVASEDPQRGHLARTRHLSPGAP
jgi:hypothetical protein